MLSKIYEKIKIFIKENYKFILSLIAIVFLLTYELPYVVYTPGGIVNLEKRISVKNGYDSKGSINMSYVTLRKGNIPSILLSYVIKDWDLLKESEVTGSDESVDDLLKLEKLYMTSSIDNATILAYKKANKKINIKKNINNVIYVSENAKTDISLYDIILSVDGKDINNIKELQDYIKTKNEGDIVYFKVISNKKEVDRNAEVININGELKVGIAFLTTYEYETDPSIIVKTKSSESGSSGGLMLSLAIYNAITKEDITKGKTIVGTGTIDILGNVGKIDGVKYKILGAVKNEADLFICPKDNYDEAMKVKKEHNLNINIISVETFDEAINYLENNL